VGLEKKKKKIGKERKCTLFGKNILLIRSFDFRTFLGTNGVLYYDNMIPALPGFAAFFFSQGIPEIFENTAIVSYKIPRTLPFA
jgi:hypothetical protein